MQPPALPRNLQILESGFNPLRTHRIPFFSHISRGAEGAGGRQGETWDPPPDPGASPREKRAENGPKFGFLLKIRGILGWESRERGDKNREPAPLEFQRLRFTPKLRSSDPTWERSQTPLGTGIGIAPLPPEPLKPYPNPAFPKFSLPKPIRAP